ncbi:N-6 DNA methylase [Microbulbifer sp. CAU 1566]|nr:N-6 DNA methylase [Microbulbifer sp. CAU 1566]
MALEDLSDPDTLNLLRFAFHSPEKLKPAKSRQQLTEEVAGKFAAISEELRQRGNEPHVVAHFVNRMIFCMFAEDIELLPKGVFTDLLERALKNSDDLQRKLSSLFAIMRVGGAWGPEDILWFNGGLFDDDVALELTPNEIKMVYEAARKDWSDIDPSIMGTLFERGLDPSKQSQLGAHYTDRDMIMKIINPVIVEPLEREWDKVKNKINEELKKAEQYEALKPDEKTTKKDLTQNARQATAARNRAQKVYNLFKAKIKSFKVLDPACGSGNFLYLSLKVLKDFEQKLNIYGEAAFKLTQSIPEISPANIYGVEVNSYAAELARVSVWIGEIQWIKKHGFTFPGNPVLKKLENIVCHDALINEDGTEYVWPKATVVVGNPPFIGDRKMIAELGEEYTFKIRKLYEGRAPGGSDFVCFWFAKALDYIKNGDLERCGLVSTNSIRGGMNRFVLDEISKDFHIYDAWPDEPWVNEGAAVRVSMISFSRTTMLPVRLSGSSVSKVYSDLTSADLGEDLTKSGKLKTNKDVAFIGTMKNGGFNISGELAREWLCLPANPNGRKNNDVLRPWTNGMDITRRTSGQWIIDFKPDGTLEWASLYEAPFEHVLQHVKPKRDHLRRKAYREIWWRYQEPQKKMREKLSKLTRYIVTPRVSKYRLFVWRHSSVIPDSACVAVCKDDDLTFGILHSKFHTLWTLRLCTWLGKGNDPRYTPTSCFETFPFPKGMEPNVDVTVDGNPKAVAIAEAAKKLNELRESWLNPEDSIKRIPEVVEGFPERIIPVNKAAEKALKKRTLTNLYNDMPTWLKNAHKQLDDAVADAYGWSRSLADEEILEKLFGLNQSRSQ